jgi:hypothetical protein
VKVGVGVNRHTKKWGKSRRFYGRIRERCREIERRECGNDDWKMSGTSR